MMRSFITGITAAAVVLFAVSVNAATVSVLWTAVNGSTIAPTANVTVLPADTLTASIYLDGDGVGVDNYSLSAEWDGGPVALLGGASAVEFTPAGFTGSATPGVVQSVTDSGIGSVGQALGYEAFCFFCTVPGSFEIGTVSFTAVAAGSTSVTPGAFFAGVDAIIAGGADVTATSTYLSAGVTVVPEPATLGLLGIGLLGLGIAGRRRS